MAAEQTGFITGKNYSTDAFLVNTTKVKYTE
jgi:hypothetical protein